MRGRPGGGPRGSALAFAAAPVALAACVASSDAPSPPMYGGVPVMDAFAADAGAGDGGSADGAGGDSAVAAVDATDSPAEGSVDGAPGG